MIFNPTATADRARYFAAMRTDRIASCVEIERRHGLHGYSTEAVLIGLDAILDGADPHVAIERHFLGGLS